MSTNKKVNTEICIDLKTILQEDRRAKMGKSYNGVLTHDESFHFLFVETVPSAAGKRNPHVFVGKYVTITHRGDGGFYTNFKPIRICDGFNVETYADGVRSEIVKGLRGLVEK